MHTRLFIVISLVVIATLTMPPETCAGAISIEENYSSWQAQDTCPSTPQLKEDSVSYCAGTDISLSFVSDSTVTRVSTDSDDVNISFSPKKIKLNGAIDTGYLSIFFEIDTCLYRDSVLVQTGHLADPDFNRIEKCAEDSVRLLNSFEDNLIYSWSPSAGVINIDDPSTFFFNATTQAYILSTRDSAGICSRIDTISSSVKNLDFSFRKRFTVNCFTADVQFILESETPVDSVLWIGRQPDNQVLNTFNFIDLQDSILYPIIYSESCAFLDTIIIPRSKPEISIIDLNGPTGYCTGDTATLQVDFVNDFTVVNVGRFELLNDSTIRLPIRSEPEIITISFGGCVENYPILLEVDSLPFLEPLIAPALVCAQSTLTLSNSNYSSQSFPELKTDWLLPDGMVLSGDTLNITNPISGNYIRTIKNRFCSKLDSINIDAIKSEFEPSWLDTLICKNQELTIDLSTLPAQSWIWSNQDVVSCTDCRNPIIKTDTSRVFVLEFDFNGCTERFSFNVRTVGNADIDLGKLDICAGSARQYIVSPSLPIGQWDDDPALSCTSCDNPIIEPTENKILFYTTQLGGCPVRAFLDILVIDTPEVFIELPSGLFTVGDIVTLTAQSSTPSLSHEWTLNNEDRFIGRTYSFTLENTTENLFIISTDENTECRTLNRLTIMAEPLIVPEAPFAFPNVFSPNDDQTNDVFRAARSQTQTKALFIYDRYGVLISESTESWDGRYSSGALAPPGIYFYQAEGIEPSGASVFKRGQVSLIR